MTLRQRSDGNSPSELHTLRADAQRFACVSGTILGREVVPEVCRTSTTSPGLAGRGSRVAILPRDSSVKQPAPESAVGLSSITVTPSDLATSIAGDFVPQRTINALAARSER